MKNKNDRRDFLKAAGATLVAASVPSIAAAQSSLVEAKSMEKDDASSVNPRPIYVNGCGWNRDLPGNLGQACFTFNARANLGGTGFGTIRDDVYTEFNSQFAFDSVTRHDKLYTLAGHIIASQTPAMVGMRVKIIAESTGFGIGRAALTVEAEGDNLVVIAIIAILIGLLLPSVQAVPLKT